MLLKLSMSAYAEDMETFDSILSASPDHDYDTISLWYAHKEAGYEFCRELWDAMVKEKGLGEITPERLLGQARFDTSLVEWVETGTAYTKGSRISRRLLRMAKNDKSFSDYLAKKNIDLRNIDSIQGDDRAADLRKVAPLVAVRDAFRSKDSPDGNNRQDQRSRKNPDVYTGESALFAIVEGNPRWFIGIMGRIIGSVTKRGVALSKGPEVISRARQAREISGAAARFRALLKAIPCPDLAGGRRPTSFLSVLDAVGEYFFDAVVRKDFTPDPPGSFIVDSTISNEMHSSLTRALNSGAIVYVPDEDGQLLLSSLRGKRFRLSYLLAPSYRIPLRLGRGVSLGIILKAASRQSRPQAADLLFPKDFDDGEA